MEPLESLDLPWMEVIRGEEKRSWSNYVMHTSTTSGRQPHCSTNTGDLKPWLQEFKCKSSVLRPTVHSCHRHLLCSDVSQRSSKAERTKLDSPVSVCLWPVVVASDHGWLPLLPGLAALSSIIIHSIILHCLCSLVV